MRWRILTAPSELIRHSWKLYKERARTFTELGEPVRAAIDLTAAADLDPADGEIFALRGLTLIQRRLYDAAVADFTRALECLPGDPSIMYNRAVALLYKDETQLALADLDSLLRANRMPREPLV